MIPSILIVDDHPQNVAVLLAILKNEGYQLLVAHSGEEAVEKIRALAPDVVLLDIYMPGLDGEEVCRWVHQSHCGRGPMLVVVTADTDSTLRIRCKQAGCDEFLLKPVVGDEVRGQVRKFVAQKSARDAASGRIEKLEVESSMLRDQVERAERLASLGTMAAGVGHELNNVATVLSAALGEIKGLAAAGLPVDEELLADLTTASRHVSTHAANLLSLGRPATRDRIQAADLRALALRSISLMNNSGRTKLMAVELQASGVDFAVAASPCGSNRCSSTSWEMPPTHSRWLAPQRRPSPFPSGKDPAAGWPARSPTMDPEFQRALPRASSMPYFTTKADGKGTGLGLCVAQQIVKSYGGEITFDSRPGSTTFRFDLPPVSLVEAAAVA